MHRWGVSIFIHPTSYKAHSAHGASLHALLLFGLISTGFLGLVSPVLSGTPNFTPNVAELARTAETLDLYYSEEHCCCNALSH